MNIKIIILFLSTLFISNAVFAGLNIQTWKTQNGSKVMFVHAPELPMVDIELKVDAGSARDGKLWGLAGVTSGLLGTATKTLTEDEISKKFNDVGAEFATGAGRDTATVYLRSLTRKEILDQSLTTFIEIIQNPKFETEILNRERARLF